MTMTKTAEKRSEALAATKLADTPTEYQALGEDASSPIIHTLAQWNTFIEEVGADSVLPGCGPSVIAAFTKGMKFNDGRLVHADFRMIDDVVSLLKFKELMASFGISMKLFALMDNYTCNNTLGSCEPDNRHMCDPGGCAQK